MILLRAQQFEVNSLSFKFVNGESTPGIYVIEVNVLAALVYILFFEKLRFQTYVLGINRAATKFSQDLFSV